jgi:hypothetical protein
LLQQLLRLCWRPREDAGGRGMLLEVECEQQARHKTTRAGQVVEFGWQGGKRSQPTTAATSRSEGTGGMEEGGNGSDEEEGKKEQLFKCACLCICVYLYSVNCELKQTFQGQAFYRS